MTLSPLLPALPSLSEHTGSPRLGSQGRVDHRKGIMWGQEHGDTWDWCWDISGHLRGYPWCSQELPSSLTGLWVSHCSYTWIVPIPFLKSGAQQQEGHYWLETKKSNPVLSYLLAPGPCSGRGGGYGRAEGRLPSLFHSTNGADVFVSFSPCFCVVLGKLPTLSGLYFLFYQNS